MYVELNKSEEELTFLNLENFQVTRHANQRSVS